MERQSPGPKPEVLLFDVYGTLYDVNSLTTVCEEIYPGRGRELSDLWRRKQLEYSWLLTLMERFEDFWLVTAKALTYACRTLGLPLDDRARELLLEQYLRLEPFPDTRETLAGLSGLPLYVLSNGEAKMLRALVANTGLQDFFTGIISADEVRRFKPSPAVYHRAAARSGKPLEAVGLISSNAWDASGAKSAGLWAGWVNRGGEPWPELSSGPDITVNRLTELVGHFQ